MKVKFAWVVILAGLFAVGAGSRISEMAELLWKARSEKRMYPVFSLDYPGLDLQTAYQVQKTFVSRILTHDRIAGYKVGLTTRAGQKQFGLRAPMSGVLLASGRNEGSPEVDRSMFGRLGVETEIALEIGQPISRQLSSVAELQKYVRSVLPAIELPDLGFADMKKLRGVDIISANAGAAQFILGTAGEVRGIDSSQFEVILIWNGKVINQWRGSMVERWENALWLVNSVVEQGWPIKPGHIFLTGVLGKLIPGRPGPYRAEFGEWGRISFDVK